MAANPSLPEWLRKVDSPFGLAATAAGFAWLLFAAWFAISEATVERISAGVLAAMLLLALVYGAFWVDRSTKIRTEIGSISPSPPLESDELPTRRDAGLVTSAPDGTYILGPVPADWVQEVIDMKTWALRDLPFSWAEIKELDPALAQHLSRLEGDSVLVVRRPERLAMKSRPGRSKVDGQTTYSILRTTLDHASLAVIPLPFAEAPTFAQQDLIHGFWRFVGPYLQRFTLRETSPVVTHGGVTYCSARMSSHLEKVVVDDRVTDADIELIFIGYSGQIRHHLVVIQYVTRREDEFDSDFDLRKKELLGLARSFREIRVSDKMERIKKEEKAARARARQALSGDRDTRFADQIRIAALELRELKLDDSGQRKRVLEIFDSLIAAGAYLKPTEKLATEGTIDDWRTALAAARTGDLEPLRATIREIEQFCSSASGQDRTDQPQTTAG